MAEEQHHQRGGEMEVEVKDRGVFDFMGKKEEEENKPEECLATRMEKVQIEEVTEENKKADVEEERKLEEKHGGLLEKLHRSHSSSSSSSDEELEEGENGEKKKTKKKGLKEKIKEKFDGDHKKEEEEEKRTVFMDVKPAAKASVVAEDDTTVVVEKLEDTAKAEETAPEEKKGFLERIKEKLPGQTKKPTEEAVAVSGAKEHGEEAHGKERKGFLEMIKEKLPGYHRNGGEETGQPAGHPVE